MKNLMKKNEIIDRAGDTFSQLQQRINSVFNDFYTMFEMPIPYSLEKNAISPSVDIIEDDNTYKVEVEMPGIGKDDIAVSVHNGVLSIEAKKEISKKDEGKNYVSNEIFYGNYKRNITLPDYIDTDKAKSTFKKGMLWVTFPKKEGSQKQHKNIKVEEVMS